MRAQSPLIQLHHAPHRRFSKLFSSVLASGDTVSTFLQLLERVRANGHLIKESNRIATREAFAVAEAVLKLPYHDSDATDAETASLAIRIGRLLKPNVRVSLHHRLFCSVTHTTARLDEHFEG